MNKTWPTVQELVRSTSTDIHIYWDTDRRHSENQFFVFRCVCVFECVSTNKERIKLGEGKAKVKAKLSLSLRVLQSMNFDVQCSRFYDFRLQYLKPIVFRPTSTESSHLTADLPTPPVTFGSAPLLRVYRDSTFWVPTCKSLIMLGRLRCFRPVAMVESFPTIKVSYGEGVVNPTPNPRPGNPEYPILSGSSSLTCQA
jgi:hypothetical protein